MMIDSKDVKKCVRKLLVLAIQLEDECDYHGDERGVSYYGGMQNALDNVLKFLDQQEEIEEEQDDDDR